MANEIQIQHSASGVTLYALVRNSVGQVWNGSSFGAYATASLATYAISLTEQGTASRFYAGTFPAASAGVYSVVAYVRAGGSPAETDVVAGAGSIEWDGSAVAAVSSRAASSSLPSNFSALAITAGGIVSADVQTIKTQAVTCSAGVTVSPYVGSTGAAVNGTTVNTLASHDPGATLGTSTLTQTQVTGGAYALNSASFAFNAALDFTTTQKAATLARVTLTDTVTTYTGNTPQTGDAFARIGATGSGLTSLAPASTALSTATWDATKASYLDAAISTRSTYTGGDTSGTTTLLSRLSATRAGYLDNLSGGAVALASGVTVTTNNDKTGYSLSQTFPTNFSSLAITVGGAVTAGTVSDKTGYTVSTVSDKTGYALTSAYDAAKTASQFNATTDGVSLSTSSGNALVSAVASQVTTDHGSGSYVRNTEPVDVSADVAAIKAKTDSLTFTTTGRVDATAVTVSDKTGYSISGTKTTLDALNDFAAGEVWDVAIADHLASGSVGAALNAAGSAGDPWATPEPGAYAAGTFGYLVANLPTAAGNATAVRTELGMELAYLDAAVSSRLADADYVAPVDVSGDVAAIKAKTDSLTFTIAGQVDANALSGGGAGLTAAEVWANPERTLTALDLIPGEAFVSAVQDGLLKTGVSYRWTNSEGKTKDVSVTTP